jgi:hypothetical protein
LLSDPLSVTYDGDSISLVRINQADGASTYIAPDDYLRLDIRQSDSVVAGMTRCEITLTKVIPDSSPEDPFDELWRPIPNSFGIVFEVNSNRFATSTDVPLLRTALLALVDSTLQGRLIGGEH